MNEIGTTNSETRPHRANALTGRDPFTTRHRAPDMTPLEERVYQLEHENHRLQALVAELLLKNQQLRKQIDPV